MEQLSLFETNKDKATRIWDEVVANRQRRPQGYEEYPDHRRNMIEAFTTWLDNGGSIGVENAVWYYTEGR